LNFVGPPYPPTPAALFRLFSGPKRRARPDPPGPARESPLAPTPDGPAISACAACRKPRKTRAFSPAPPSPRATRSPAPITRSAGCGASAWRSPTARRSRATPGAARTKRRCATHSISDGDDPRAARPSDSPGAPAERLDVWIVGRARCLSMMRSRTSATLAAGEGSAIAAAAWRRRLAKTSRRRSARPVARRRRARHRLRWPRGSSPPDSAQRLRGGRPRLRPTAAASVCSNVWSRSAQRVGSRVGRPSASTGFRVMGRRARPKELLALDALAPGASGWAGPRP